MNSSRELASPLGLHLTFAAGKGIAALRSRRLGKVDVERLDLEIPRLVFPFDVSEGVGRFQNRRCIVRAASFSLSEEVLQEGISQWFPGASLQVKIRDGYISISGRFAWRASEALDLTMRLYLDIAHGRIVLALLDDLRLYGVAPAPVSLVARAILSSIQFPTLVKNSIHAIGVTAAEIDPLRMMVATHLPRLGWKIPDLGEVRLEGLFVNDGKISFVYGALDASTPLVSPSRQVLRVREALRLLAANEEILLQGRLEEALRRFQKEAERVGHHPLLDLRIGEILAADPEQLTQAQSHLEASLQRHQKTTYIPRFYALLAQALLRSGQKADHYLEALADISEEGGDPEEALWAGLWLARSLQSGDPNPVIERLERLSRRHLGHLPTLETLADLYERASRYESLALLWREMASTEENPKKAAFLRTRLGDLYRVKLDDSKRAKTQYERAIARDIQCVSAWQGLAQTSISENDTRSALVALDKALQHAKNPEECAEIHLRAGVIWEEFLEDSESASLRYGEALTLVPNFSKALSRMAALHVKCNRFSQAAACYEELIRSRSISLKEKVQTLLALATLLEEFLGDPDEAYTCARRVLELEPENEEALRLQKRLSLSLVPTPPKKTSSALSSSPELVISPPPSIVEPQEKRSFSRTPIKPSSLYGSAPKKNDEKSFRKPDDVPFLDEKQRQIESVLPQNTLSTPSINDSIEPPVETLLLPEEEPSLQIDPLADQASWSESILEKTKDTEAVESFDDLMDEKAILLAEEQIEADSLDALAQLALGTETKEPQQSSSPERESSTEDSEKKSEKPKRNSHISPTPLFDIEAIKKSRATYQGNQNATQFFDTVIAFSLSQTPETSYALSPEDFIVHPGIELPPQKLFLSMASTLGSIFGNLSPEVEQGPAEIAQELFSLAARADAPPFMLRWIEGKELQVVLGEPPAIEVGVELSQISTERRRFLLSYSIAKTRFAIPLVEALSAEELEEMIFLIAASCDPVTVVADEGNLPEGVRAQVEALLDQTPLSKREELLSEVSTFLDAYTHIDFEAFRQGLLCTCAREALVHGGDLYVALDIIAKESDQSPQTALLDNPVVCDLILFSAKQAGVTL